MVVLEITIGYRNKCAIQMQKPKHGPRPSVTDDEV